MRKLIYITIASILFFSCKKAADIYIGIPLQPKFDENSFRPGLNIFGVIRPDSTDRFNNSFVEIEKVIPAVGTPDSLYVDTVLVYITNITDNTNIETEFKLSGDSSIFNQTFYRPANLFTPLAGETFHIECNYPGLPVLTANTTVPNKAEIDENSIINDESGLYFEIKIDTTIYMYDIYAYTDSRLTNTVRFAADSSGNTQIVVPSGSITIDSLVIYSYDAHLANYYLTSNISLNFNKYRNPYTEVKNGYGVFGSVNKTFYKLK